MKKVKLAILKRIFVLFCSTLLLITNIFLSYNTAVHAADDYDIIDAFEDICAVILVVGGALSIPASGGLSALGYVSLLSGILGLRDNFSNLYDYITDNGDGTYMIDESLIQAALQAAEELEAQGFTDSNVQSQGSGYLYNYRWACTESYMYNNGVNNKQESYRTTYNMATEKSGRVAGFKESLTLTDGSGRSYVYTTCQASDKNNIIRGTGKLISVKDGNVTSTNNNYSGNASYTFSSFDGTKAGDIYSVSISFGGNFPIFSNYQAMMKYIQTGQGYKDALNYRATPLFRKHSSYTPIYSGGAVTVNRTVIENITNEITEVDADDSLTDDQKIEILQQYILSGGNPTPTPPPAPSDPDYDDNKDLSAGEDLTDTNSWLKKIYLKICQIYAKMNAAVEDAEQSAFDKIQESLEDLQNMLQKYLSEITGDLDDIKGQLEDMSEQEFSEKTESFLDDTLESFSEVSEKAKGKFPFSIPNDMRILISKMSVSPPEDPDPGTYSVQTMSFDAAYESNGLISVMDESSGDVPVISETGAPIFYIPFVIASAGIEQYVLIDLSGFESISSFCRSLMTIYFILCLFNLTFKVMGLWGDLVD